MRANKAEPYKHGRYRGEAMFNKCARPAQNSCRCVLVEHIANQFWLVPRNILLAGLEIITEWRANDPVGKQRDQIAMDCRRAGRRRLPAHPRVK